MSPLAFGIVRTRGRLRVLREVLDSVLAETIRFFEAVVATCFIQTPDITSRGSCGPVFTLGG